VYWLRYDLDRLSVIQWLRHIGTTLVGQIVKESLDFYGTNPQSTSTLKVLLIGPEIVAKHPGFLEYRAHNLNKILILLYKYRKWVYKFQNLR
jgi:hypothetical protein